MATPTPVGGGRVSRGGNRTKVLQVAPKQQQILQQQQAAIASQLLMPGSLMQVYVYSIVYSMDLVVYGTGSTARTCT